MIPFTLQTHLICVIVVFIDLSNVKLVLTTKTLPGNEKWIQPKEVDFKLPLWRHLISVPL